MAGKDRGDDARASVRAELGRVLSSAEFKSSARISNFLRFIVDETLDGRGDRLKGYTIGVQVFGRDESFDPQTDSIVRVEAGRLRRMLNQYYLTAGSRDPLRIDLPKGGYVPEFQDRTELLAAQEPASTDGLGPADASGRDRGPPTGHREPFVAVLAFDNMSGDPGQDFFCDGISEEIITELNRFQGLNVLARNSSFQYRGTHQDVRTIGSELGVHYVLEGSVRKAESRIRVTAQLIDTDSGEHLWAESFDRDLTVYNLLDIQESIAAEVVGRVADVHGVIARARTRQAKEKVTENLDVYEHMLRFYDYVASGDLTRHGEIRACLERAVEADPGYSDAWAALAWIYGEDYRFDLNLPADRQNSLQRALDAANRAVELSPRSAFAYQQLSLTHFCLGDLDRFRSYLEQALEISPNNTYVLADGGVHLAVIGDWERAIPMMEKAISLNPAHPGWYYFAFFFRAYQNGEYLDAYDYASRFRFPGIFWTHAFLAAVCAKLGRQDETDAAVSALLEIYPDFRDNVARELRKWHTSDRLTAALMDGFAAAGLVTESG